MIWDTGRDSRVPEIFHNEKTMNDPMEEAAKVFKTAEPQHRIREYEREQQAIRNNHQRLKAERLAREAGTRL
jgi:hypothetical protein